MEDIKDDYINFILDQLKSLGAKSIVITGISYKEDVIGIAMMDEEGNKKIFKHERVFPSYHGTGDIFTSVFLANYLKTNDLAISAGNAAKFVINAILNTKDDSTHTYGVKFESILAKNVEETK